MALIETENSIVYSNEEQEVSYQLYDILWSDGKATQEIRPVSDGVVPIGLCVIPTNWLDEGEKARFVSLKYMSSRTPKDGGLEIERLIWGAGYDKDDASVLPFDDPEDDPLKKYYVPYACKNETSSEDVTSGNYYWSKEKDFKDLRDKDNWLYTLNYCKQNPGKYAIGDINGKQNTINISIEGAYYDQIYNDRDMKYCIAQYEPQGTQVGDWYIPAAGELLQFTFKLLSNQNTPSINDKLAEIAKVYPKDCVQKFSTDYEYGRAYYWSSTVFDNGHAFNSTISSSELTISSWRTRGYHTQPVVAFLQR